MTAAWGLTSASSVRTRRSFSEQLLVDLSSAAEREGDQVLGTGYYLIHRFGQTDAFEYNNLSFSTETEATAHACSLIAAGELGNFVIKDGESRVVADDTAIKAHCKRHPIDYRVV